jgi:hypothetical protein
LAEILDPPPRGGGMKASGSLVESPMTCLMRRPKRKPERGPGKAVRGGLEGHGEDQEDQEGHGEDLESALGRSMENLLEGHGSPERGVWGPLELFISTKIAEF